MSVHSDETDFLLLIPPDFFSVSPDELDDDCFPTESSTAQLYVNDLITQLNDLEGRVCLIESRCTEEDIMNSNLHHLRHYGSADTLHTPHRTFHHSRSLQATPLKSRIALSPCSSWKTNDSSTYSDKLLLEPRQNMLRSNQYLNQKERDNQTLKEVQSFFRQREEKHKKKNSDTDGDAEKPQTMSDLSALQSIALSERSLSLNKVNDLLKQLEETKIEMERKLKIKELNSIEAEAMVSFTISEDSKQVPSKEMQVKTVVTQTEVISKDEKSPRMKIPKRALNFDSPTKRAETKQLPAISNNEFHCGAEEDDVNGCINKNVPMGKKPPGGGSEVANLLSLSNLWGASQNTLKTSPYEDQQILKQRLEEERCRRQHCEEQIQQLQLSLLEEQQKIAVAVKVDEEKDLAIKKLTEGWDKVIEHWRELESQRNTLAKRIVQEREKFAAGMSESNQTVKRHELEVSKALDLAHGYKEKCEAADKEKKQFRETIVKEVEVLKKELKNTFEKLQIEEEAHEKLKNQLQMKEESCNISRSKISELNNQLRELKKQMKELEADLEQMSLEKEKLAEKYKDEKGRVTNFEQNKKTLQQQNEELKRREIAMKEEVQVAKEQVEKTKLELKEFYQEQVESIVQGKLKEFQEQLRSAEKMLQKEIEVKEKLAAEAAMKQVQQIVNQHEVEVKLLEEKHKEEIELWKVKLAQCEEKVGVLRRKLDENLSDIAQKLHSVMETQWQEALKIITSSQCSPQNSIKSPVLTARSDKSGNLPRQLTYPSSNIRRGEGASGQTVVASDSSSPSATTETPFCKDDQMTCREQLAGPLTYRIDETPQKQLSDDTMKKFILAALECTPSSWKGELEDKHDYCDDSSLSYPHWKHLLSEASSQSRSGKGSSNKPPWK